AVEACGEAVGLLPGFAHALLGRASALAGRGEPERALDDFGAAIACARDDPHGHYERGRAYQQLKRYAQARDDYSTAVRLRPDDPGFCNQLAWLLATCPDDAVRDGPQALGLATRACERSGWQDPVLIDTLAAACAECGQFEQAVERMKQVLARGPREHRDEFQRRLRLFQARKPYRMA